MTTNDMATLKKISNGNDYTVAKALNTEVLKMIALIVMADLAELPEDHEIKELNRAYILIVDEVQKALILILDEIALL